MEDIRAYHRHNAMQRIRITLSDLLLAAMENARVFALLRERIQGLLQTHNDEWCILRKVGA